MNQARQSGTKGQANRDGLAALAILVVTVLAVALVLVSII